MPYKSMAQERFAHTPEGEKKFGAQNVQEFDQASNGMKLPPKAPKRPKASPPMLAKALQQ